MSKNKKDPCKANACKIQACLKEHRYQEGSCLDVLEEMRLCCVKWHKDSLCCSGINLDKSYFPENKENKDIDQEKPNSAKH